MWSAIFWLPLVFLGLLHSLLPFISEHITSIYSPQAVNMFDNIDIEAWMNEFLDAIFSFYFLSSIALTWGIRKFLVLRRLRKMKPIKEITLIFFNLLGFSARTNATQALGLNQEKSDNKQAFDALMD